MKNQDKNKNINNKFYDFIRATADLIGPFIYLSFLSQQHIFLIQKESIINSGFAIWSMWSHAHTSAHA